MSEQSGGGPITREQVERAIDDAKSDRANRNSGLLPMSGNLGENWRGLVPDYVNAAWSVPGWDATIAALTRWHDELAAAEPVRRVARWDATRGAYVALDAHGTVCMITSEREQARDWGYEPEGGPEPVQPAEDSPERLRERRERLGLSAEDAAVAARMGGHANITMGDVMWMETPPATNLCASDRARYAAALSAEEARLAKLAAERDAHAVPRLGWIEPERPAPRFQVGDWVRRTGNAGCKDPFQVAFVVGEPGDYCYGAEGSFAPTVEHALEPASPPAPEVVDVPQPETWHARLVRLSRAVVLATKAHDDAQSARHLAETRADEAWKALRAADHALKDATECAAILTAAQQGGA